VELLDTDDMFAFEIAINGRGLIEMQKLFGLTDGGYDGAIGHASNSPYV
jgi:hypothetical protein